MANRKRNIQMKFWVTEEEKRLIEEKMAQLHTKRSGAYLRKMAIDGYIIQVGHHRHQGDDPHPLHHRLEHQPNRQAVERWRSGLPGRHGGDPGEDGPDMAVTKTHPIKSTLKAAIDYICNPDKRTGSCWCPPLAAPQRQPILSLPGPVATPSTRARTWAATSSRRLSLGRSHRGGPPDRHGAGAGGPGRQV